MKLNFYVTAVLFLTITGGLDFCHAGSPVMMRDSGTVAVDSGDNPHGDGSVPVVSENVVPITPCPSGPTDCPT